MNKSKDLYTSGYESYYNTYVREEGEMSTEQTKSYLIQGLTQFVLNERELIAQGKTSRAKRRISQYISAKDKSLESVAQQIWDTQLAPKNRIEQVAYDIKPDYALRVGIEDAVQRHFSGTLSSRDESYRKLATTPRPSGFKRAIYGAATGLALMAAVATANISCHNPNQTTNANNQPVATLSQNGPSWCIATNEGKVSCTPFEDDAAATQPAASQPASCPTAHSETGQCSEARFEFKYNSPGFTSKDAKAQLTDLVVESTITGLHQFYINAYASIDGKTSRNQRLSERRARAIAREVYNIAKKNKLKVEVFYAGKGETQSIDEKVYAPNRMAIVATSPMPDVNTDGTYATKQKGQMPGVAYNQPCVDGDGGMKRYVPTPAKRKPAAEQGKRQIEPEKLTPLPITIKEKYEFKIQDTVDKEPSKQIPPTGVPAEAPATQPAKKCKCKIPQELSDRISGIHNEVEHLTHDVEKYDWLTSMVDANCSKDSDRKNLCAVQDYKPLCCKKGPKTLKKGKKITACQQAYVDTKSGLETARNQADKIGREIDYARSHASEVKRSRKVERMIEPAEKKLNENYKSIDSAVQRLKVPDTKKSSKPQASLNDYTSTGVSYAEVLREYTSTKQDRLSVAVLKEHFGLDEVLSAMPEYNGGRARANSEERTARREIAYEAYTSGTSKRDIADALGVSRSTIDRDIRRYEQNLDKYAA